MTTASHRSGFSFIELIVVMGVIGILLGFATVSLLGVQRKPALTSSVDSFISDIRGQQVKALAGNNASSYGVYVGQHDYTLFTGSVYNANDPTNALVSFDPAISISTLLANAIAVFASGSGEMVNFLPSTSTITITNTQNNERKTIQLNRYGVVTLVY